MKKILAIALLALAACANNGNNNESNDEQTLPCKLWRVNGDVIEQVTIGGHDYLLFFGGIANPPTVLHSESCQCQSKTQRP